MISSKKLTKYLLSMGVFAYYILPQKALAQCTTTGTTTAEGINCAGSTLKPELTGSNGIITNVINVLIIVVGTASVIMVIIGALRLVTSSGNENAVKDARNTILYAVIGLVIAITAFAIVNFVLEKI